MVVSFQMIKQHSLTTYTFYLLYTREKCLSNDAILPNAVIQICVEHSNKSSCLLVFLTGNEQEEFIGSGKKSLLVFQSAITHTFIGFVGFFQSSPIPQSVAA